MPHNVGTVAAATDALAQLKKTATAADKEHYDTLAGALKALGDRVQKLEQSTQYIDRAMGMAAAAAGYVASVPGAGQVDLPEARAMARELAGVTKASTISETRSPADQAEANVGRVADVARKTAKKD